MDWDSCGPTFTPFKQRVAGAFTRYAARVQSSNVGRRKENHTGLAIFAAHAPTADVVPTTRNVTWGVNSAAACEMDTARLDVDLSR